MKWITWSAPQRKVILALLVLITAYLTIRLALNRAYVSDPQPLIPPRASEVEDRIDPNTAQWPELAALPVIGERRARDIVAYREQFVTEHPGQPAFSKLEDLDQIRGIGTATLIQIEPYLIFPKTLSTTSTQP